MFTFISIFVPVLLYLFLPLVLNTVSANKPAPKLPLGIACFLFFISWYLPSPLINGEQTAFFTHFVGGGVFCGLLWVYIRNQLAIKQTIFYDLLGIYFLVSALGVANELFEFAVVQAGLVKLNPSNTWWDLLANTSGGILFWIAYILYRQVKKFV